jgi:hypothetical protein
MYQCLGRPLRNFTWFSKALWRSEIDYLRERYAPESLVMRQGIRWDTERWCWLSGVGQRLFALSVRLVLTKHGRQLGPRDGSTTESCT